MKVIDLLNKIANGEEVPKKIRITDVDDRITRHYIFFYDEDEQEYKDDELMQQLVAQVHTKLYLRKMKYVKK